MKNRGGGTRGRRGTGGQKKNTMAVIGTGKGEGAWWEGEEGSSFFKLWGVKFDWLREKRTSLFCSYNNPQSFRKLQN